MKPSSSSLSLLLCALFTPTTSSPAPAPHTTPTFFALAAAGAAAPPPLHLAAVAANETGLWVGKRPSAYCPGVENQTCPAGGSTPGSEPAETRFSLDAGVLGLAVQAAGGQQVYVDYAGRVRYTRAGDGGAVPNGGYVAGWEWDGGGGGGAEAEGFGRLTWVNGTYLCSADSRTDASVGPWQMVVRVPFVEVGPECVAVGLVTSGNYTRANAWEYV